MERSYAEFGGGIGVRWTSLEAGYHRHHSCAIALRLEQWLGGVVGAGVDKEFGARSLNAMEYKEMRS